MLWFMSYSHDMGHRKSEHRAARWPSFIRGRRSACLLLFLCHGMTAHSHKAMDFQGRQDGRGHHKYALHCIRETLRSFETVSSAKLTNQKSESAPKQQPLLLVPGGKTKPTQK